MKVLELFAGTRSIGKAFETHGHEVYSIDWCRDFDKINWYADIGTITPQDIYYRFGVPDVIWASPDCTTQTRNLNRLVNPAHLVTKRPRAVLEQAHKDF